MAAAEEAHVWDQSCVSGAALGSSRGTQVTVTWGEWLGREDSEV